MLRLLILLVAVVLGLSVGAAVAEAETTCVQRWSGRVSVACGGTDRVEVAAKSGGGDLASGSNSSERRGERVCTFGDRQVPCWAEGGAWIDHARAWCTVADPQPPHSHSVWNERADGSIWHCVRPRFDGVPDPRLSNFVWMPSGAAEPPPPPDPVELAWRAVASLQLEPPSMGMFPLPISQDPDAMSYVGWNNWLWVDDPGPQTWGPASASASDRGYTVTIQAAVSHTDWDMGNGDVVRCQEGMKHPPSAIRNESSPQCGYMYEMEGIYVVSATTYWRIDWSGVGRSGTLELELTGSEELLVGEVQVVNVPVNQR